MDGETELKTDVDNPAPAEDETLPAQVFIAFPHNGNMHPGSLLGLCYPSLNKWRCSLEMEGTSALTRNFNLLLLRARTQKVAPEFMAMHHADVSVPPGWIDMLHEELEKTGADIVSSVIPIKDARGLTTTGVFSKDGQRLRRFTMKEVMKLPETFNAETAGYPGHALVINTGLWLMRMDRPWVKDLCFKFEDEFTTGDNGELVSLCRSEDWLFSEDLAKYGARVFATRRVPIQHWGQTAYGNDRAWGMSTEDPSGWAKWR